MFKLLKFLGKYKKEGILSPIFKLTEAAFELTVPLVVAAIIDNGIMAGDKLYILKMCGVLGSFAVLGLACAVSAQYFAAKAAVGFASDIREAVFRHIGKLSFSQLDGIGASTLITRLTGDINQVQSGVNLTFRLVLRSPIVVFGAVIMAFTVDVKTALVFAVAVPILAVVIFAIMLVTIPLYKKVQQRLDTVLSEVRENLIGARVVRAFCKEHDAASEFNSHNAELNRMQLAVGKISAFMNPVTFVIINLAVIALIYIGAVRVNIGGLTSGEVVAQYNYMSQILVELIKLASLIISITKAIASGNRIEAVLSTVPQMENGNEALGDISNEYAVCFNNVSLNYGGENSLNNINLKIKRGSSVGIIGSTGSGKSSLINLIPRFYDATEGEVTVDGVNVRDYDIRSLRKKIGFVAQKKALFKGSVRDNVRFGFPEAADDEIWQALKIAQAEDMVKNKTGELDFMLEQEGKNLSGGQRQRLTIARAVVGRPEILILDDAASALDYATAAALNSAIKNTDFSPTVITVSQRISAIRGSDVIVVLDEGEIVGIGNNNELIKSCPVYREIYESQLEREAE